MEFLLNHPWLLGLLTAFLLSGTIEAGYQTALRFRIQEDTNRKDQMAAIRDGLFILVGLLFGFTLALAAPRFAVISGFQLTPQSLTKIGCSSILLSAPHEARGGLTFARSSKVEFPIIAPLQRVFDSVRASTIHYRCG